METLKITLDLMQLEETHLFYKVQGGVIEVIGIAWEEETSG